MQVGPVRFANRVILAPMSGITDRPFRALSVRHGAGMVVSEMIAGGELGRGRGESGRRLEAVPGIAHMVQLAGREPATMAEAARIAEGEGADIVDINMGCPAKKVIGGAAGAALMREPDRAIAIVAAVVAAVKVPVTVKMRLGWDAATIAAPDIARRAEAAGASMITVHGRTREQFYRGSADWTAIAAVRAAISVPLVVNGDILDRAGAERALAVTGADAAMIGRGACGQPWLPGEVAGAAANTIPGPGTMIDYITEHYEEMLIHYGRERGLRHARKHLGWYLDRLAPSIGLDVRTAMLASADPVHVMAIMRDILAPGRDRAALSRSAAA